MDVRRGKTDVRWVGFHPLKLPKDIWQKFRVLDLFLQVEKGVVALRSSKTTHLKRVSV